MKKFIIATILFYISLSVKAQTSPALEQASNSKNSTTELTINGIPYSQYKAQVQAQQTAKVAAEAKQIAAAKQQQQNMLGSASISSKAKQNTQPVIATKPVVINNTGSSVDVATPVKPIAQDK